MNVFIAESDKISSELQNVLKLKDGFFNHLDFPQQKSSIDVYGLCTHFPCM